MAYLTSEADGVLKSAITALGEDSKEASKLRTFFTELKEVHQAAHRDLEDCKINHSRKIPGPPPLPVTPGNLVGTSSSGSASGVIAAGDDEPLTGTEKGKKGVPFRFKQEEVEFVRAQRNQNVSIDEILMSILEQYPRWRK